MAQSAHIRTPEVQTDTPHGFRATTLPPTKPDLPAARSPYFPRAGLTSVALHQERRRRGRTSVVLGVRQRVGRELFLCQASDLSPDGILLSRVYDSLYSTLPRCWIEFGLPGHDDLISARGQVVRQTQLDDYHLMAVRFASIARSHQRLIENFGAADPPTFLSE